VIEHAPFGVIGAITPVTHSLPTITGNAVSMIAAGNTVVVNPHPSGKRVAAEGVRRFNEAIERDLGMDNLICVIAEPTLESAAAIFKHRDVALICVTGGAAVARAALNSGKRAIVAGPGNPPIWIVPRGPSFSARRTTTTCSALPRRKSLSWPRSSMR
jgi:aldehyde dehydrogenase